MSNIGTVWMEILRAHRPVRYSDIRVAVPEMRYDQLDQALRVGAKQGYIEREGRVRDYVYTVTPRCNVPPGVRVLDVMEATA